MVTEFLADLTSVVAVMAISLALVRWRTGKLEPPLVLAVLARVIGALTLILGGVHLLEIGGGLLIGRRPYKQSQVAV